ncbi:hypothetical protein F938_03443 [Acinetobacter bereziniae LMG 1003 = CIP 70.12]|jgi:hypothetical protein|uniref:DUF2059 domain-containing protein n=1 Tax=Acinetobacter bereziniae LMG 1003 = CIP 70.12 TaxID=981324 RepID=N9E949_ACIBZ|nr:DUF2059 domain-containing protein [Acinetobacter bereziniae]ENV91449.1 hypothetical protein F938_03443 [Acinetobacter bereziniae LMG 1003 = CIP 70.12]MBJ9907102.1 DUF2059 domain-containing protein [Acinetobacter bereziniae]MBJ9928835.1 DUF2059 domain-containing protein [Acinetobacter bereziniae]
MKLLQHLVLLGSCLTANFAFAAQASDQQVQQLLKVMNIDQLLQETMQQIRPQLDQQAYQIIKMSVNKEQLSPQEQIVANELADKMYAQSQKTVSWEQIKPLYLKIYKDVFNAEEVQAQIDFYSSAVGQSILKKSPQIAQETMKMMNTQLSNTLQNTEQDFKEINKKLAELKKAANTP